MTYGLLVWQQPLDQDSVVHPDLASFIAANRTNRFAAIWRNVKALFA
jgi:hypothetical protein